MFQVGQQVRIKKDVTQWPSVWFKERFKQWCGDFFRLFKREVYAKSGDIMEVVDIRKNGEIWLGAVGTQKYGFCRVIDTDANNLEEVKQEDLIPVR